MTGVLEYLSGRVYPGRGILLGKTKDGSHAVATYFIMGRSANSRNRIFEQQTDGSVCTRPFDAAKVKDPSLILYTPVRTVKDTLIVTNGDQTDTITDALLHGGTFRCALLTRTYEPDSPNFTPRISGMLRIKAGEPDYTLSILRKKAEGMDCDRSFFHYEAPRPGECHIIHTYLEGGDPLVSFSGDPVQAELPEGDIDAFTGALWDSLNADNRISLFARFLPLDGGEAVTRICNKYTEGKE
jgi:IMP cyclohydrolase